MALYGSSIPLDDGSFVTTVICPNAYSHQRLMQAINNIVPEAAAHHATEAPMPPHLAERLDGRDDDEGEAISGNPDYRAGGSVSDDEAAA